MDRRAAWHALVAWCLDVQASEGRMPTYAIETFGCQQNDHDSERAAGLLEAAGLVPAPSVFEADIALFNTCSVRANADDRFFGHVGRLKSMKQSTGRPIIVVFGCMMAQPVHRDTLRTTFPYCDVMLGAGAVDLLPEALADAVTADDRRTVRDWTDRTSDPFYMGAPPIRDRRHRALVTIMTGCNNFCSYCIVPYTRGREVSRSYDAILRDVTDAAEAGAVEVMLLGQNVNSYGNDVRRKGRAHPTFAELLEAVAAVPGIDLVRYMTSHPKDLSDELIEVIGRTSTVEPHIHLPLQSGSDRILKAMNRRYTADRYLKLVDRLRAARPGISITTDLIVGFPGETDDDFEATLRVMEAAQFDAAFTFIYSPRVGTPAAEMIDVNDRATIQARFERLVDLQNRLSLASNERFVGQTVTCLVDGPSRRDPAVLSARTRDSRLVNFTVPDDRTPPAPGDWVVVAIERVGAFSMEGTACR
jgi:tRNA-2-methylthio-N6-dimethylallyladenosine synthase